MQSDANFDETKIRSFGPHLITQGEIYDRVRAELLGCLRQQWNILTANVKISIFRDRQQQFKYIFVMEGDLVACSNINGVMEALGVEYEPSHWRLFIV